VSTESVGDGLSPMARQPAQRRPCPIAATLEIVGERWSLVAIRELAYGVHRFDQIAAYTGASRDILAERLRKLERLEIVERRRYSDHPPRSEYHLTDKGGELLPVLMALGQWGTKWARPAHATTWLHECGHVVVIDHTCHDCGGAVSRATVRAVPYNASGQSS
jgi:DNA-binding HxlR family transcriptional regulator